MDFLHILNFEPHQAEEGSLERGKGLQDRVVGSAWQEATGDSHRLQGQAQGSGPKGKFPMVRMTGTIQVLAPLRIRDRL